MLLRLARRSQWGALLKMVSPRFFDVLPTSALRTEAGLLMTSARDASGQRDTLRARAGELSSIGWTWTEEPVEGLEAPSDAFGQQLLTWYFLQLRAYDRAVLDLRAQTFEVREGGTRWRPRTLYIDWDADFIGPIRRVYQGFYEGDDVTFEGGLEELGMPGTSDLFRQHFGVQQDAVAFDLGRFQGTFHEIFERCRNRGLRLHHNFVSFGVYLGTLYENLDRAEAPFDVRSAYFRAKDLAEGASSGQ